MGRSAKLHKRVVSSFIPSIEIYQTGYYQHKNTNTNPSQSNLTSRPQSTASTNSTNRKTTSTPAGSKKRKDLKSKVARQPSSGAREDLLNGADYVTLMLGGRRKAKEEAKKLQALPPDGALSSLSL